MVENVADILKLANMDAFKVQLNLPVMNKQVMESPVKAPKGFSENEMILWKRLGSTSVHIDELVQITQLPIWDISTALLNLELAGFIEDLGAKHYVRFK